MNTSVKNTLSGRKTSPVISVLFKPTTILALVLIGIFSFAALLALSGYADDLRKDVSGKATASSRSAIGYAGYVQLLKDMDYEVTMAANPATAPRKWKKRPLRIYTLVSAYQSRKLKDISKQEAKLIILPKWRAWPKPSKPGWVEKLRTEQLLDATRLSTQLEKADISVTFTQAASNEDNTEYKLRFAQFNSGSETGNYNYNIHTINSSIEQLQSFDLSSEADTPDVILRADDRPILVRLKNTKTYILSEPDILNTHGIATRSRARLAVNILDVIADYEKLKPGAVDIDLSIHGLGGGRNIIKLMTQPPFLAATLCLLAAGGIIAWQAFSRFGDAARREPDFAQGPVSLAKSAAEFMSISNRVEHMGPDYAQLTRQQVVRDMGLIGQSQDSITRMIEAREKQREISPSFAELTTQNTTNLTDHARAMIRWKEEMMS